MNVRVVHPGHGKADAVLVRNGTPSVDEDGVLTIMSEGDNPVEIGRFTQFQSYWTEESE